MLIGTATFPCNSDRYQKPRQCEGDMMLRVRHAEGGSVYFYLMWNFSPSRTIGWRSGLAPMCSCSTSI